MFGMLNIKAVKNLFRYKKKRIIFLGSCAIVLMCAIILISLGVSKHIGDNKKNNSDIEYSEKDMVEEKAEGGLIESELEDGPDFSEDTMIDFGGNDVDTQKD